MDEIYEIINGKKYKKCKENQIRNPISRRCIYKDKKTAKDILLNEKNSTTLFFIGKLLVNQCTEQYILQKIQSPWHARCFANRGNPRWRLCCNRTT